MMYAAIMGLDARMKSRAPRAPDHHRALTAVVTVTGVPARAIVAGHLAGDPPQAPPPVQGETPVPAPKGRASFLDAGSPALLSNYRPQAPAGP